MSTHPFLQRLHETPLLADGAMGTMLYAKGASSEQCLEYLVISRPAWVSEVHQAYATAGADIIKTHTFGANRVRLADYGLADKVRDLNFRAVKLVRDVREVSGRALFIAGDVGPLGKRLQPEGPLSHAEARAAFREQVSVLWEAGADLLLFETFVHVAELEIAIQVAREVCDLPIVASMTFAEDGLTMTGHTPAEVVGRVRKAGADVVGVNCSVGPAAMLQTLEHLREAGGDAPLIIMPNAGFPERVEGRFYYPSSPEYFARQTDAFLAQGACIVGGCCGTTPMHIRAMRAALDGWLAGKQVPGEQPSLVIEDLAPAARADYGVAGEVTPTGVLSKLRAGKFVISVEVDPPRSFTAEKQIEG
ncbi:MAG: homocysteine S-methyltransferase family protein, partial [Caldilinea sp.]|nr:homocysteine S-methyltransferase family protein [Caldilinea sp.]